MEAVSLLETDRLLIRQRLVLEKLLIHFEGALPGTAASTEVALRIAHELVAMRGLEETIRATFDASATHPK
jgi:hypothetical protein